MASPLVRNPGWPAVLGTCLVAVLCGVADGEQLPVRSFGIEDGLAGDSVTRILQDGRGYLWIGSAAGLLRGGVEHLPGQVSLGELEGSAAHPRA